MSEEEAREWPDLMEIVEAKVKPERDQLKDNPTESRTDDWWQFGERSIGALRGVSRARAGAWSISQRQSHLAFAFLPMRHCRSRTRSIVFALDSLRCFLRACSRASHEIWARFFGSSMEDDLRYTPSDCFETFPFPENWETDPALEAAGKAYYEFRAALMVENDEGLTKTYNRFHDPDERDPEILKLRELHAAMDRAVLDAYGWSDIPTDCEFLLDYEIDEEEWGNKKKPWRYRWPDEVRDEVLARLLELNAERAKEEARAGAAATKKRGTKAGGEARAQRHRRRETSSHDHASREHGTGQLPRGARAAGRGPEARPRRPLGRTRARRGAAAGLGAALELVSDRLPDPVGHAAREERRRRRGRRHRSEIPESAGLAEESNEERKAAKKGFFPSSMGLSFLVPKETRALTVTVRWGDYAQTEIEGPDGKPLSVWQRHPREATVAVPLTGAADPVVHDVPDSGGLQLHVVERPISAEDLDGAHPAGDALGLGLPGQPPHPGRAGRGRARPRLRLPARARGAQRPTLRAAAGPARRAGRGVGRAGGRSPLRRHARVRDRPRRLGRVGDRGRRLPSAPHGVDPERRGGEDGDRGRAGCRALDGSAWGARRRRGGRGRAAAARGAVPRAGSRRGERTSRRSQGARRETAEELLRFAGIAADRIERGIAVLAEDADALDAFRVANRAVARALRKRLEIEAPRWRAFQLAFILLNLPGLADPRDPNRETVDLLFFPTGGGKTEAYLGLAAFAMVLRRLRHPGEKGRAGAGVSVIMRYTLRLLTLDQLARAAGLVCALELEREQDVARYGEWPFEIGLWVGKAATPNILGRKGDGRSDSARTKVRQFKDDPKQQALADPARELPLVRDALRARLLRAPARMTTSRSELRIVCTNFECDFTRDRALPDRRRGRADLPAAAGLPDRDGGQVRLAAVGRAGRGAARRCGPARREGLLRGRGAGQGHAARSAAAAARPRHPGRAAPDLGAARHDGRPLRGGDRGALRARDRRPRGAAQDRRLDRHRAPGAGPDPGALRAAAHAGVPAAGAGPAGLLLRADRCRPRRCPRGSTSGSRPRGATRRC